MFYKDAFNPEVTRTKIMLTYSELTLIFSYKQEVFINLF